MNWNYKIRKAATYLLLILSMFSQGQKINLLPDTLSFCMGDSAVVEIRQQLDNQAAISWFTPQGIITNTKKVSALRQGKYAVKVQSSQFNGIQSDSTYVKIFSRLKPLMNDTMLCKGKSLLLDARYPGLRYYWSTGETTQRITIESPGRYWVKILNGSCQTIDSVRVRLLQGAGTILNPEATFCYNDPEKILSVRVNPGTKIFWNNGATTPSIHITKEGSFWVRTENGNCGSQVDSVKVKLKVCECEMMIPNSFTPNEDNRNDYFFPVLQCEYSYYNISISDRWGNTVYYSNNPLGKWDGRFKGNLCPEDIYIYRIESTEKGSDKKQVRNGQISLFR